MGAGGGGTIFRVIHENPQRGKHYSRMTVGI